MIVNILALIVVLGVLIFIHEGGHFLAARWVGAPVSVFSFGFGRRLFGFKRGETDYRLSLIPLGGYVRIHGLGPDESDVVGAAAEETPLLPRWQRALISIAGPAANALFAVIFVAVAAFLAGRLSFPGIGAVVADALEREQREVAPVRSLDDVIAADARGRSSAGAALAKYCNASDSFSLRRG